MLKRRRRAKMGVRTETRVHSPSHLAWVRGHECAIAGKLRTWGAAEDRLTQACVCSGRVEAHHVRVEGDGTTGAKPSDEHAVALCSAHHELGHRIGWKSFEAKYRVDLTAIAVALWHWSPHGAKYRAKMKENA